MTRVTSAIPFYYVRGRAEIGHSRERPMLRRDSLRLRTIPASITAAIGEMRVSPLNIRDDGLSPN